MGAKDLREDVRAFLMSRRAHLSPRQVGITPFGERRVPGLRREEVASIAGISPEYYTRLERGGIGSASPEVLVAVARALQLDDVEQEHLFNLARAAARTASARQAPGTVRASVQQVLASMSSPTIVHSAAQDLVAANEAGRALYSPMFDTEGTPNIARFVFLDHRARDYYPDWRRACRTTAAMMRLEAGRDPLNKDLAAVVDELAARSPQFREDWGRHDVHEHRHGVKAFRHPEVGWVDVSFNVFEMPGEPGLQIVSYGPVPGTDSASRLALLAHRPGDPGYQGGQTTGPG